MYEQLVPCDHCGGRPTLGYSQRVARIGDADFDYSVFGGDTCPPVIGDRLQRPPGYLQTEKLVCVYCAGCGMTTPWEPVGNDEKAAMTRCGEIWNRRLNRPQTTEGDIHDLIRKEVGVPDTCFILALLAGNRDDWESRGPVFAELAQRLIDATVVTLDSWPIDPVLKDAARYRKLMQLAKWFVVDGEYHAEFPKIPSPKEHAQFPFEDRLAVAVDAMPDRDRW